MRQYKYLLFVIVMFLISSISAGIPGYCNSNIPGGEVCSPLTSTLSTESINYSTVNVNNSQFLLGYTWLTNPYFSNWSSTYNATYDSKNTSQWMRSGGDIYYQNLTGKVGIGITTPANELDVNGTTRFRQTANATKGFFVFVNEGNTGTGYVGPAEVIGGSSEDLTLRSQTNLQFMTNGATERARIDTSGNMGIGTKVADNKLDIVTGNVINSVFHIGEQQEEGMWITSLLPTQFFISAAAEYTSGNWIAKDTTSSQLVGSAGTLQFRTNSGLTQNSSFTPTERMRIDTTGNVGIGTTTPLSSLHVVKQDEVPIYSDVYSNTNYAGGVVGRRARGSSTTPLAIQTDDYITAIFGRGYNGSTFSANSMGIIGVLAESNWSGTTTPTYINFRTAQSGATTSTERMRITSTGNVGIGTTNPTENLETNGVNSQVFKQNITNGYSSWIVTNYSATNAWETNFLVSGNSPLNIFRLISPSVSKQLQISNGLTSTLVNSLLYVTSSYVGIGTTSPTSKLHLSGGNMALEGGNLNVFNATTVDANGKITAKSTAFAPITATRDSTTGGILGVLHLNRLATGITMANKSGAGIYFSSLDRLNATTYAGFIGADLFDNTNGSEIGELVFSAAYLDDSGLNGREHMKIKAFSTTQADVWMSKDLNITGNLIVGGNLSAKRPYGMYSSTEDQTLTLADTAYPVTFNWTEDSYLITKEGDSNFSVAQSGDYLVELSAIFQSGVANKKSNIWVQIYNSSGSWNNVPRSNTQLLMRTINSDYVTAVPFILDIHSNEKFRIMWAGDDNSVFMNYMTNTSYAPETPSIIMTISKISDITP